MDCACKFQSFVVHERLALEAKATPLRLGPKANSKTTNVKFVQKAIPKNFFDLKCRDIMVMNFTEILDSDGKLFVADGFSHIFPAALHVPRAGNFRPFSYELNNFSFFPSLYILITFRSCFLHWCFSTKVSKATKRFIQTTTLHLVCQLYKAYVVCDLRIFVLSSLKCPCYSSRKWWGHSI